MIHGSRVGYGHVIVDVRLEVHLVAHEDVIQIDLARVQPHILVVQHLNGDFVPDLAPIPRVDSGGLNRTLPGFVFEAFTDPVLRLEMSFPRCSEINHPRDMSGTGVF